jgi:ABC-type nitrate/sulfonate/bicarbonate transport system substrate-binding protein
MAKWSRQAESQCRLAGAVFETHDPFRSHDESAAPLHLETVAASAPGTEPYFGLAWMLKKNGLPGKDVKA